MVCAYTTGNVRGQLDLIIKNRRLRRTLCFAGRSRRAAYWHLATVKCAASRWQRLTGRQRQQSQITSRRSRSDL